ncbi:MAG: FAD-binding protein [Immundisolibacteraceae bacterium]|nr:FAD-binding protein [Immundisolibacteraceae bacterium]
MASDKNTQSNNWDQEVDWIVVGSGGGGMTSALAAKHLGMSTLIIEKSGFVGGSTARSGGCVWIPNNYLVLEGGLPDTPELAKSYLASTVGDRTPTELQHAFLEYGPPMIEFLRDHSQMHFEWSKGYADYYAEQPGGFAEGRALEPLPFNLHKLKSNFKYLRPPVMDGVHWTSLSLRGLQIMGGLRRHPEGRKQLLKTIGDTLKNLLTFRRMATMGQGVAGRLYQSIIDADIAVELNTPLTRLIEEDGRVVGIEVAKNHKPLRYRAKKGVLLSAGGFAHNQAMREKYHPYPTQSRWSISAESNTGDGINAGSEIGGKLDLMDDAWWGPVSQTNSQQHPQFAVLERSTPGAIIVNGAGQRFVNEAAPYADVVNAMHQGHNASDISHVPSWIILDRNNRNSYFLGTTAPAMPLPGKLFRNEDFFKAKSLSALAQKIGIPADALEATVSKFNGYAEDGVDADFHRGESAYDQLFGDTHFKNSGLAPLTKAPFYAIKIVPGDIGTRGGLVTNEFAQVIREDNSVIEGLWATGNSMASVMGHSYPGPGATIGPAMTFGYIAAQNAAGQIGADPTVGD